LGAVAKSHPLVLLLFRAERKKNQVCSEMEYTRVFSALQRLPEGVEHLVVQLGEL
jgi:hypothetical protein